MFTKNKKQYINILQENKQLKLDYTSFENDTILKHEQSSFLMYDKNSMPQDALVKLNLLQKDIPVTYLTALIEIQNQKIINTKDIDTVGYDNRNISNDSLIQIPKNEFSDVRNFFLNSGIDFILSPYTVLFKYIENNSSESSLGILIYNKTIYSIITDQNKNIIYSKTAPITSILDIDGDSFSDNDKVTQELYDEVHLLEIEQFLNDSISQFYENNENKEIKNIDLLNTIQILNSEQISKLHESTMIEINYETIKIEEYLNSLHEEKDFKKYSFIKPREKKVSTGNKYLWGILVVISFAMVAAIIGLLYNEEKQIKNNDIKKEVYLKEEKVKDTLDKIPKLKENKIIKKEEVKKLIILKPNHKEKNKQISQEISMLLDTVPYDAILKDVVISHNSSTFVVNFITDTNSLNDMQSKLNNIYKDSVILLKHQNNAVINTIIENNTLKMSNINDKSIKNIEYKDFNFLSSSEATSLIKSLVQKDSNIKFVSKTNDNFLTYTFTIVSQMKSPKDLFDLINKLNKENKSINIALPIKFSRVNTGLEIKYNVQINQDNKSDIKLKK